MSHFSTYHESPPSYECSHCGASAAHTVIVTEGDQKHIHCLKCGHRFEIPNPFDLLGSPLIPSEFEPKFLRGLSEAEFRMLYLGDWKHYKEKP